MSVCLLDVGGKNEELQTILQVYIVIVALSVIVSGSLSIILQ